MSFNSFGDLFRLTTFGESHGIAIGGVIDGCPSNIKINFKKINNEIIKRKTNQSDIVSNRNEKDKVLFLSGIYKNKTLGSPIGFIIINKDMISSDYNNIKNKFRPSHADYTYYKKYKVKNYKGGGRSSARETLCRVIAGNIAKQIIKNINVYAYVTSIGKLKIKEKYNEININNIKKNIIRCPNQIIAKKMISYIRKIKRNGDSIGGQIICVIKNLPAGIGDPIYKKLNMNLAEAMFSINAVKAFEYGSGFKGTKMLGSSHNDIFIKNFKTKTNYSGGIQGGISNGMDIYFKVGFKPTSTILKKQYTLNIYNKKTNILIKGRHDPCVLPRAVSIVEAMTYLVLINKLMYNNILRI
ncbi:MAG: chorismate synthase [Candidatus Shikimatogenerans sp. Ttur]|uniref:Chorismate synthase n=1 Tax=Candidatus Shikimatogenerans sp. Ttur TaxID=3158569 RepID=A0AAU7ZY92_9FLAO